MINEFERLAYCLTTVAGFQKSIQQVQSIACDTVPRTRASNMTASIDD